MNEQLKQLVLQKCKQLDRCEGPSGDKHIGNINWVVRFRSVDEKEIKGNATCWVCKAKGIPAYGRDFTINIEGKPEALVASDELLNTQFLVNVTTREVEEVTAPPAA